jgi:hypothetical protein
MGVGSRRRHGSPRGHAAATAAAVAAELADPKELLLAYDADLLGTAAGLFGPLAGARWSVATATGLALELGAGPAGAPITAGLAEVLRDPALELRLSAPHGSWTDEAGPGLRLISRTSGPTPPTTAAPAGTCG